MKLFEIDINTSNTKVYYDPMKDELTIMDIIPTTIDYYGVEEKLTLLLGQDITGLLIWCSSGPIVFNEWIHEIGTL